MSWRVPESQNDSCMVASPHIFSSPCNMSSNSNNWDSSSQSNRGDWNAPIHCRKFVCRTCKCKHYPDCSFDDENGNVGDMCEDCFDGEWGCHKATKDMYVLAANPLYDPARCGISRPLHNFNNRFVAMGRDSRAALANMALTNAQMQNLQQQRARLSRIGRSVFGGRLSQRGRRILSAMEQHQYAPGGSVFRGLQQQYTGGSGFGRLENVTLANRLRALRNSRRRAANNSRRRAANNSRRRTANNNRRAANNTPLANRLRQLRNSRNRLQNMTLANRLSRKRGRNF